MESGIFTCPREWERWLPQGVCRLDTAEDAQKRKWSTLALTPQGYSLLKEASCDILLLPGGSSEDCPDRIKAASVITYGLSRRDSLTLSSLEQPVLCVQRALPRIGGGVIEPQEIPLPQLPFPAAELLPLLGLHLLRMQLTETDPFCRIWKTQKEGREWNGSF